MDLARSLRRRWILVVVLFALTIAATMAALFKLPSTYQSKSAVLFLASKNVSKSFGGNPYLAFSSTLNETADVIRYEVTDASTSMALASRGYSGSYTIVDAFDTSGPILLITVTGSNKTSVEHTLYGVTQQVGTELSQQQAGVSAPNTIHDLVITFSPEASRLTSKKSRPLSVVFGIGIALTIAIPLIVDAALLRRRRNLQTGDWASDWQKDDWAADKRPEVGLDHVTQPLGIRRGFGQLNNDQGRDNSYKGDLGEPQGDSHGSELPESTVTRDHTRASGPL